MPCSAAMRLLVLGAGFTGSVAATRALERGFAVRATTRDPSRRERLAALGIEIVPREVEVDEATDVIVTFPPDDDAATAARLRRARSIVYVSSSVVYGQARGRVDESTPLAPDTERGARRVEAERLWRDAGATVVRAPAIYGPGRGLHLRAAAGTLKVAGEGTNVVSRVHVQDLADALVSLAERGSRGELFVAGDRLPAPHVDVIRFVCAELGVPEPAHAPAAETEETLRNERALDATKLWASLGREPRYPTYRDGYRQCIEVDLSDRSRPSRP